ncbi:Hypothetical protein SMAX5B_004779 [Scophthalmus maximus]|uniref:Uncharacterized protein n=1 Tax=Scophthalmus maximus TaxID=52904 RepID=A0A2U9CAR8_SCOMX|nr:Hypothetical protein SMAX5B_004779 [Scophthalmus maximus]
MDVSIAVSLIRGQMGAVVERAVNGAVETVLAEMLKVVGVKFEELKTQLALMKRDVTALQREKALKEKENDNIRSKLRYTELKLKYYRQGVEEELQQREAATASASTLVHVHQPSTYSQTQRAGAGLYPAETSSSCSTQTRNDEGSQDTGESADAVVAPPPLPPLPPPAQALTLDPGKQSAPCPLSLDSSAQADSSTLPPSAPQVMQVKQEQKEEEEEEEEEVICIKEEPEEEQEVMATLVLDCQMQHGQLSESETQSSVTGWPGFPTGQRNLSTSFSSAPSSYLMLQPEASQRSMGALPCGLPPRQAVRPWAKDFSLYEEYKLRRNELRRRSLNRRRELEKTLPQPLLADMVRERREKTRLRVARWRAKRKLQACLNQTQTQSGAAGLSQTVYSIGSQHQELRASCASTSGGQQRRNSTLPQSGSYLNNNNNNTSAALPFMTSSPSLLQQGSIMAAHQHAVTSTSSSSFPQQVSLSQQGFSLTEADVLQ